MKLVDQWRAIEDGLPADWLDVQLTVRTEQPADLPRAAAVLGAAGAGHAGEHLVIHARKAGSSSPAALRRLFARLDGERVWCTLETAAVDEEAPPAPPQTWSVADSWDRLVTDLPDDWSELLCRLDIAGSDLLPRAALLCAPLNPTRDRQSVSFVFRAGRVGYGVTAGMARRCFERLDAEGIHGSVSVLRMLSDTHPVASQGSSWIVGGHVL
jgi:hypothetical protein